jgi:hypothetical protein
MRIADLIASICHRLCSSAVRLGASFADPFAAHSRQFTRSPVCTISSAHSICMRICTPCTSAPRMCTRRASSHARLCAVYPPRLLAAVRASATSRLARAELHYSLQTCHYSGARCRSHRRRCRVPSSGAPPRCCSIAPHSPHSPACTSYMHETYHRSHR